MTKTVCLAPSEYNLGKYMYASTATNHSANATAATSKEYRCEWYGYYRLDGLCERCPADVALRVLLVFGISAVVGGLALFVYTKTKIEVMVLSIAIDFFQSLGIVASIQIDWPPEIKVLFRFMSLFNFDIDIIAPECVTHVSYELKWIGSMVIPVIVSIAYVTVFVGVKLLTKRYPHYKRSGRATRWREKATANYVTFMTIMYLGISKKVMEVFNCTRQDGRVVLKASPKVMCVSDPNYLGNVRLNLAGDHGRLIPLAVFSLIWFSFLVPILMMILLFKHRKQIKCGGNEYPARTFKYLFYRYKPHYYWWGSTIFLRKLIIAFIAELPTFTSTAAYAMVQFRAWLATLTFTVLLVVQIFHNPFAHVSTMIAEFKESDSENEDNVDVDFDFENGDGFQDAEFRSSLSWKRRLKNKLRRLRKSCTRVVCAIECKRWARLVLNNLNTVETTLLCGVVLILCGGVIIMQSQASSGCQLQMACISTSTGFMFTALVIVMLTFCTIYILFMLWAEVNAGFREAREARQHRVFDNAVTMQNGIMMQDVRRLVGRRDENPGKAKRGTVFRRDMRNTMLQQYHTEPLPSVRSVADPVLARRNSFARVGKEKLAEMSTFSNPYKIVGMSARDFARRKRAANARY